MVPVTLGETDYWYCQKFVILSNCPFAVSIDMCSTDHAISLFSVYRCWHLLVELWISWQTVSVACMHVIVNKLTYTRGCLKNLLKPPFFCRYLFYWMLRNSISFAKCFTRFPCSSWRIGTRNEHLWWIRYCLCCEYNPANSLTISVSVVY